MLFSDQNLTKLMGACHNGGTVSGWVQYQHSQVPARYNILSHGNFQLTQIMFTAQYTHLHNYNIHVQTDRPVTPLIVATNILINDKPGKNGLLI